MAEISDFLLAVHPAVNTFVCHAPSSFFFILHKGLYTTLDSMTVVLLKFESYSIGVELSFHNAKKLDLIR